MKHFFYIVLLISTSFLLGCVTEDDVFNDDSSTNIDVTETALIVSFLNEKYSNNEDETNNCSSLIFPIDIAYNTGQIINVINEAGLKEVVNSQSSNFHINGIVYPITLIIENVEFIIENNTDFNTIFQTCNINTLNTTLVNNINNCFDFQYPITLLDNSQNEVSITTSINFVDFIENQDLNYTATFEFPFLINETTINNYFDIYQITNNCIENTCSEIFFESTLIENNNTNEANYIFEADELTSNSNVVYSWSVDGVNIDERSNILNYTFNENGTYTVCVFSETPECTNGIESCQEIIVDSLPETIEGCPQISFTTESINNNYTFEASGLSESAIANFSWSIDGEFISDDLVDGDNKEFFSHTFTENRIFTVCIFIETPECSLGVEYCREITVTSN